MFLNADPDEALIYSAIVQAAEDRKYESQKRQATLIANAVGQMLKGAFGK